MLSGTSIYVARSIHEPLEGSRKDNYYISGYFSLCSYRFQFFDYHITTNNFSDTLGHMIVQIAQLPTDARLPPEAVNDWTMIQHEDALIREGGSDVIRRMRALGPHGLGADSSSGARRAATDSSSSSAA